MHNKYFSLFVIMVTSFLSSQAQQFKPEDFATVRNIRRAQINDPIRPTWHLTIAEGFGMPFDPNGAIYKDGVYHLWYLYQAEHGHHWQHLSSIDLFHWRWHANDLKHNDGDPDEGIFSGNAFLANDGNVVMAYHGLGTEGNCVAFSSDKNLDLWQKPKANPIAKPGWDPHMWVEGDTYFQISGGVPVSSGKPNPPVLYTGKDYKQQLTRVGNFMTHDMPDVDWFEDVSCPDFFKLDDKWVLLCISHSRGARYYIGTWDGKQFKPESHHRMNWPGGTMFAPETLLDDKGRRIMWAWVLDRKSGVSSGTMSMPRVLTLSKDKRTLDIAPPKEIERLRFDPIEQKGFKVNAGEQVMLQNISGNVMEMEIVLDPGDAKRFGVKVLSSKDGQEHTPIIIDRIKNLLQVDMRNSSLSKPEYNEFAMAFASPDPNKNPVIESQDAPFELKKGEKVHLRIFLDKSILEVFANGKQCITQVVYPTKTDALNVQVFSEDAAIKVESVKSWKLFPAMQW